MLVRGPSTEGAGAPDVMRSGSRLSDTARSLQRYEMSACKISANTLCSVADDEDDDDDSTLHATTSLAPEMVDEMPADHSEGSSVDDTAVVNEEESHFASFLYEKVDCAQSHGLDTTQHSLGCVSLDVDMDASPSQQGHTRARGDSFSSEPVSPVRMSAEKPPLTARLSQKQLLPVQRQPGPPAGVPMTPLQGVPHPPKAVANSAPPTPVQAKEKGSFFSGRYLSWVPWGKGTSGKHDAARSAAPGGAGGVAAASRGSSDPAAYREPQIPVTVNPIASLSLPGARSSVSLDAPPLKKVLPTLDEQPAPPPKRKWCCLS